MAIKTENGRVRNAQVRASKRESGSCTQTQDGNHLEVFDKEALVFDIAPNHPFRPCCITNKKGNVNHCDVTKAYFGILTANRWKATYQNVLPDHSNTQHQYWAHSGGSGASNPSAALRGHIGPRRHSAFRGWPLAAPDFFRLVLVWCCTSR